MLSGALQESNFQLCQHSCHRVSTKILQTPPLPSKMGVLYYLSQSMSKPAKPPVRSAKTQISLGICPVWSESLLCAQCVAKDPRCLHTDSKDSDQTGRMPRLIWVFAGHTCHFVVLSCSVSFSNISRSYTRERSESPLPSKWVCCTIWARACQNQQNHLYAQQRLRSAWASAQSDQSLCCALSV